MASFHPPSTIPSLQIKPDLQSITYSSPNPEHYRTTGLRLLHATDTGVTLSLNPRQWSVKYCIY